MKCGQILRYVIIEQSLNGTIVVKRWYRGGLRDGPQISLYKSFHWLVIMSSIISLIQFNFFLKNKPCENQDCSQNCEANNQIVDDIIMNQ